MPTSRWAMVSAATIALERRTGRMSGSLMVSPAAEKSQARRNANVPLVPPKPKLFLIATSIFRSRAVFAQ